MQKYLPFILILFIGILNTFSQKARNFLYADVKDKIGVVYNAHIINLNTKQGTFTNEDGEFRILAKENDSLQISFVGYKTIIYTVKKTNFGMLKKSFVLKKETYILDEVELKKTNLIGSLELDVKETPDDKINNLVTDLVNGIKKIDFRKDVVSNIDQIDRMKAPNMQKQTDPVSKFAGAGANISFGKDQYAEAKRELRKKIIFKENFPKMLLSRFGGKFFFVDLQIPKEKYYHFLEYCNPLDIEELYKSGKILELIKILQQESKTYLKVINLHE